MTGGPAPRVSVAMPTYRRGPWLVDAIGSVLAQSFGDFELVVSDNGPGDDVRDLVTSLADPRVRFRTNGRDIGPTQNAVAAYRACRAPLIATLHDDDLWEPSLLERLVPPLEHRPDLAVAFSDHWLMDGEGRLLLQQSKRNTRQWGRARLSEGEHRPFTALALLDRAVPITISAVFRKDGLDLDDVPEQIGTAYDLWFAYQLSRTGLGMWYSSERLARHRVHQERLSAGDRFDLPLLHCYERWADEPGLEQLRPQLRRAAGHRATGAGLTALEGGGDRAAARRLLLQGARDAPSPRALLALALSSSPSALRRAHGVATAGRRMLRRPQ